MLEKLKRNKRKIIIASVIIILLVSLGIIVNTIGRNNKITEIAKAEEEYNYDKPYIPEGFRYVEGTWDTGYVIEDSEKGNQFVWIPVDGTTVSLKRKNFSITDITMEGANEELDDTFSESVEKYGGYYVGRYESGVPEGSSFESEDDMDINGKPVIKNGVQIWNNISYSNAKTSAEQMYATKSEITSNIMNSYAYDTMLTWIESKGYNVETDSKDWGNYSNNSNTNNQVETAGSNNNWKANNIYDIAGNISEWTSEKIDNGYIHRGGSYYNDGNITPAGYRAGANETKIANNIGFRVLMYKTGNATIEGYNEPYVPTGFTHTEGEWNTGFVIKEDSTGNEFVWIPVDGYNLHLDRSEFENTFSSMAKSTDTLEMAFKLSVYTYGGYYVGRYEAGISETSGDNVGTPVSIKGAEPWTSISRTNAKASAEEMYASNTEVSSKLMNSYAYDTMLNWLKKADYSQTTYDVDVDSSTWGNYKDNTNATNKKSLTGSNEAWKANNIYDIAGNVWELTTESYNKEAVARGGDYLSNGEILPAGTRDHAADTSNFDYTGFRVMMYKKVDKAVRISEVASIGDFVYYDAGVWTETSNSQIRVGSGWMPIEGNGISKNKSYNATNFAGGWRILDISDGIVTIIHAGIVGYCNWGNSNKEHTDVRLSSMNSICSTYFKNSEYASSASVVSISQIEKINDEKYSNLIYVGNSYLLSRYYPSNWYAFYEVRANYDENEKYYNFNNISNSMRFKAGCYFKRRYVYINK